jgi:hypothetical protein
MSRTCITIPKCLSNHPQYAKYQDLPLDSEGRAICPHCTKLLKCGPGGIHNLVTTHLDSEACKQHKRKSKKARNCLRLRLNVSLKCHVQSLGLTGSLQLGAHLAMVLANIYYLRISNRACLTFQNIFSNPTTL